MLDKDGYRLNIGIILANQKNKIFLAKRIKQNSWQFPQGGIQYGETLATAMYRELREEIGLNSKHVKIIGRTKKWMHYNFPKNFNQQAYKGQKQIWFLLRFLGKDNDISLNLSENPEFDNWKWTQYWFPLKEIVEFKYKIYQKTLIKFSFILF
ncbi:MAG: RNA pyrophosphohydrolase [Bordetella sp.]|nr:MAG: RNA pyrophosphohydrolase [Bordetella sp.]